MRVVPVLLVVLLLPTTAFAAFDGRDPAVASLRGQQDVDGGWGSRAATDWVIIGLSAAGEDVRDWDVETYLVLHPPDPLSLLAWERSTLALACSGFDARNFHGVNYALRVELGFTGNQFGSPAQLNDDYWAILALRASGTPALDPRIQLSASHVIAGQHASGGWGWAFGGAPDPDDTGAALMALAASAHSARGEAVAGAMAYLRALQNPDGGWPIVAGGSSNLLSTAWVTMGLMAVGENVTDSWVTAAGHDPIDFLAGLQGDDGGFDYSAGTPGPGRAVQTGTALPPLVGATYVCLPNEG